MIKTFIQLCRLLIVMLINDKQEPVYSLHKRKEPLHHKRTDYNLTFILLTLTMVLFFVIVFCLMINGFSATESGLQYNQLRGII